MANNLSTGHYRSNASFFRQRYPCVFSTRECFNRFGFIRGESIRGQEVDNRWPKGNGYGAYFSGSPILNVGWYRHKRASSLSAGSRQVVWSTTVRSFPHRFSNKLVVQLRRRASSARSWPATRTIPAAGSVLEIGEPAHFMSGGGKARRGLILQGLPSGSSAILSQPMIRPRESHQRSIAAK